MGKRNAKVEEDTAPSQRHDIPGLGELPAAAIRSASKLFSQDHSAQERFLRVLIKEDAARPVVLTLRGNPPEQTSESRASWTPPWITELDASEASAKRSITTSEPYLQGDWYVLDHSSVFCAAPLFNLTSAGDTPGDIKVLDVCASPGGKALMAWKALSPSLIVVNEPLPHRIKALISNVKRCRVDPCVVTRRDASQLGAELPHLFNVVVIDAPCSGQSLRAKSTPNAGAFHSSTVNRCVKRQRHILASSRMLVTSGGYLLYSTCTYGREENEAMIEWFLSHNSGWKAKEVPLLKDFQSHLSGEHCYRLWPFQGLGAGGFCCLLRAPDDWATQPSPRKVPHLEWSSMIGQKTLSRCLEE